MATPDKDTKPDTKPKEPEFETAAAPQTVVITADRFLDGQYIKASPEAPAFVAIPKGHKIDRGMTKAKDFSDAPLKPHYVIRGAHPQSVQLDDAEAKPADTTEKRASGQFDEIEYRDQKVEAGSSEPASAPTASKDKRPSDKKVI